MAKPLVSVVLITYKRPDRLRKAIGSVLKQTFKDFELLVVDGANLKENKVVVKSFKDKRVKYLQVEPEAVNYYSQKGMQHSRNVGCMKAKGDYIAMLDDDDEWDLRKLEKQLSNFINGTSKVGLVICYNKIVSGGKYVIDKPKLNPNYKDLLKSFNLSSTSTFLIKRTALQEVGYWNENLRGMHEYDIALKLTRRGYLIRTVPMILMTRYRISNEDRGYYYIKIAEVIDLWKYYGKDFISNIGITGFAFNAIKTIGLFGVYLSGYIIKERVWDIIYPFKVVYEQGVLPSN